jgi:hypothetical protein
VERDAIAETVEHVAVAETVECVAVTETVEYDTLERAAHWAAEMEKALAYRRDVDRRKAVRHIETQHRLERRQTLHCQDATIGTAMEAIDGARPAGQGDGATQP